MKWKCKPSQKRFLHSLSRECCYDAMVVRGIAHSGKCGGVTGGDRHTEYLNYHCVSCPYLELKVELVKCENEVD